jgi:hypothetical protein
MVGLKKWSGSAYLDAKKLRRWTGSAYQDAKRALVWDGTKYVQVWPTKRSYRDDFNRANGGPGSNWRQELSYSSRILTNRLQAIDAGSTAVGTAWMTWVGGPDFGALATDSCSVTAQLITPVGTVATDVAANSTVLVIHSPEPMTNGVSVYAEFNTTTGSRIATASSGSVAVRATGGNVPENALVSIEATTVGAVCSYVFRVNGSITISWNDTTGVVPRGPTNRRWGVAVSSHRNAFSAQRFSPAIDWVEGKDL